MLHSFWPISFVFCLLKIGSSVQNFYSHYFDISEFYFFFLSKLPELSSCLFSCYLRTRMLPVLSPKGEEDLRWDLGSFNLKDVSSTLFQVVLCMTCAKTTSSGHGNIIFKKDDPKWKMEDSPISAIVPGAPLLLENHACIGFPRVSHTLCDGKGLQPNFPQEESFFSYILCVSSCWVLG